MTKMKDLIYAKYGQTWYRPKIIQKIWVKCYFVPVLALKYIKAEIDTKCNIMKDPEFRWLIAFMCDNGRPDFAVELFETEYTIRSALKEVFETKES